MILNLVGLVFFPPVAPFLLDVGRAIFHGRLVDLRFRI
jgi:hypothetical protein